MNRYIVDMEKQPYGYADRKITIFDTKTGETNIVTKKGLTLGKHHIDYDQELCNALFEVDPILYKRFPIEFRTGSMTDLMIEKYYRLYYEYYPLVFRYYEMTKDYLKYADSYLYYVPDKLINQELCDWYLLHHPYYYFYVPREYLSEELQEKYDELAMKFGNPFANQERFVPGKIKIDKPKKLIKY